MNEFMFRVDCNPPSFGQYSLPILIETDKESLTEQEVLQHCIDNMEFHHDHHSQFVTGIKEIDKGEYHDLIRESFQ